MTLTPGQRQSMTEHARSLERYYRSAGLFDAAVAQQRIGDILESGEAAGFTRHIDRGIADGLAVDVKDGFLRIYSGDGAVSIGLTSDRAGTLFLALLAYLDVSPQDLYDVAMELSTSELRRASRWLRGEPE